LGVCLGAALLSKITAFLVVPWVFLALIWDLVRMKERRLQAWGRALGIVALACVVISGWHYVRVWQEFGNPLGWHRQWSYGSGWWQENGYVTADYYLRFGSSFTQPFYSAINSFADGVYSTLWGEGLYNGVVQTSERPPWNYDMMSAGYLLALLPTLGIVAGILLALWKFLRQPSIPWAVFLGLFFSFAVAMVYNSLQVPGYGSARASFGLLTLLPLCAFAALGLDALLGWRSWLRFPLIILLITWALVTVSSLWVSKHSPAKFLQARMAMDAKEYARASELAQTYLRANPNAVEAELLYTDALFRLGQTNKALESAQLYAEKHPGSALAFLDLSAQLAEQQQLDSALVNARRAVELAPENYRVRYHLARIFLEQKKFSEAAEAARECLRLKPWDTDARSVLDNASDSLPK
jgi:tetratricopeptide (TPR) repeat protein